MQFHFLRKWQELSWGVRTTCRGFHLAYFHSYWWIKSVTRRPRNSHTEGRSRPCIRAFLWCDRQCTRRTGYIRSVPGVEVRSIYKIFVWKNLKFFLKGTLHGPNSPLLPLTCCIWISVNQLPTERRNQNIGMDAEGRKEDLPTLFLEKHQPG